MKANIVDPDQTAGSGMSVIDLSVPIFRLLTVKVQ